MSLALISMSIQINYKSNHAMIPPNLELIFSLEVIKPIGAVKSRTLAMLIIGAQVEFSTYRFPNRLVAYFFMLTGYAYNI